MKDGLRELGLEERKSYVLEVHDLKGNTKAAEEAARSLERGNVNLIYVISTSPTTAVKRATVKVPIVVAVGSDPVVSGLVEGFAKPGGRLTGIHFLSADLTGKRLEILKEILPALRKVVTFYDPGNESAVRSVNSAREAGRRLKVEIVERHVRSVDELQLGFAALDARDAEAYFYTNDAMVVSQAQYLIEIARAKKLPTMFNESGLMTLGALVTYGVSYREIGRLSACSIAASRNTSRPGSPTADFCTIIDLQQRFTALYCTAAPVLQIPRRSRLLVCTSRRPKTTDWLA